MNDTVTLGIWTPPRLASGFRAVRACDRGYSLKWSDEYEFELRAKERLKIMLPVVFVTIFMLLYMVFRSVTEALILIFPMLYAMTGGLLLQWYLVYNFSVRFGLATLLVRDRGRDRSRDGCLFARSA
jgi:multidrug efflux pump subunit AcrB